MIFDIAPFPPIMFKSALESLDSCHGPYSQLNSFRNSNVLDVHIFSLLVEFFIIVIECFVILQGL